MMSTDATKPLDDEAFNPLVTVTFKLGFRERERLKQLAVAQEMNLEELMLTTVKQLLDTVDSETSC